MHPLQKKFASAQGEAEWEATLRGFVSRGEFARAQAVLDKALAPLEGEIAELCRAAAPDRVAITGMAELAEAVTAWEGAPITGLTLAIGNDADLAFEKGRLHHPHMLAGLHTDDGWNWSTATRAALLAECEEEAPGWAGREEDIEAWLDVAGLDALNTALVHHKQRHLIRDGDGDGDAAPAPLRYVEYAIGCWWRALRFHQAVAAAVAAHPLPGEVAVLSGMVDMRPGAVCALVPPGRTRRGKSARARKAVMDAANAEEPASATPDMAAMGLIQRKAIAEPEGPPSGAALRRQVAAAPEPETAARPGLFSRLFGRGR